MDREPIKLVRFGPCVRTAASVALRRHARPRLSSFSLKPRATRNLAKRTWRLMPPIGPKAKCHDVRF